MRQQVLETLQRKNILYIETLESTQNYAQLLLSKNKPIEGTAILTYNQTAGRGQYDNKWHSEPEKNISISFILYPDFLSFKEQFMLSKVVALATRELIAELLNEKVYIKWPNDIIVNNKKLGGILINNSIQGDKWVSSIIGIGLNVNQQNFPDDLPFAISLNQITSKEYSLEELSIILKDKILYYYGLLKNYEFEKINDMYLENLLGFEKELIFINSGGEEIKGTIKGVEENGSLIVKTKLGREIFSMKEISLVL